MVEVPSDLFSFQRKKLNQKRKIKGSGVRNTRRERFPWDNQDQQRKEVTLRGRTKKFYFFGGAKNLKGFCAKRSFPLVSASPPKSS